MKHLYDSRSEPHPDSQKKKVGGGSPLSPGVSVQSQENSKPLKAQGVIFIQIALFSN